MSSCLISGAWISPVSMESLPPRGSHCAHCRCHSLHLHHSSRSFSVSWASTRAAVHLLNRSLVVYASLPFSIYACWASGRTAIGLINNTIQTNEHERKTLLRFTIAPQEKGNEQQGGRTAGDARRANKTMPGNGQAGTTTIMLCWRFDVGGFFVS